jgi:D-3-phosphoglycerate dehydrogenase
MKILIASSIYPQTVDTLRETHDVVLAYNAKEEVLKPLLHDREILIFRSGVKFTADVLASAPALKMIIRAGSGVDNIDLNYVNEHGIQLVRIPGPGAKAVAELSFAYMLALARNVLEANRLTQQGHWAKNDLTGYLLTGKVLGVIGVGNIGSRVAQLGTAWGMKVIGCVENPSTERTQHFIHMGVEMGDCKFVLCNADFVSIHVPLKPSTRYLINAQSLACMKPGAFLINMARGGVVDEMALGEAIKAGRIRGAALDVHEAEGEGKVSPLAGLPNVILSPHIGAGTFDTQREIGEIILHELSAFMDKSSKNEPAVLEAK